MYTSTVTRTGQIPIPAPLRRRLGFEPGTKVVIVETDDGIEVRPLDERYYERFAGVLLGEGNATHELLSERQTEKARENGRGSGSLSPSRSPGGG